MSEYNFTTSSDLNNIMILRYFMFSLLHTCVIISLLLSLHVIILQNILFYVLNIIGHGLET